jgi:hypothetical protein
MSAIIIIIEDSDDAIVLPVQLEGIGAIAMGRITFQILG